MELSGNSNSSFMKSKHNCHNDPEPVAELPVFKWKDPRRRDAAVTSTK
jgi:hypothetical protein